MGAQLWLGPESSVSHASAAALWELPGFIREPLELSTPRPKKPLPPVVVHRASVDLGDHTTTVGPVRVTNVGRTLVDIAGSVTPDLLERCLEDAVRRRLTSLSHLRWLLRDRKGKGAKGIANLRRLVQADPVSVTGSDFEVRLLQALRRASLPAPVRQHEIFDGSDFVARVDFAYPHAKVAIEADGYRFHFRPPGLGARPDSSQRANGARLVGDQRVSSATADGPRRRPRTRAEGLDALVADMKGARSDAQRY